MKSLPEFSRPLNDKSREWLSNYSDELMAEYPASIFSRDIITASFIQWQQEHAELVKMYVYNNIEPYSKPKDDYLISNKEIIKKQLVLAGYRLANVLNCEFKTKKCIT